jgi:hypothetical protein
MFGASRRLMFPPQRVFRKRKNRFAPGYGAKAVLVGKRPLFKKSGAKIFCYAGPVAAKPARPKGAENYFLFTKSSLPCFL